MELKEKEHKLKKMKIIDCLTYNGEWELFEIRYNILKDYVDEFRVVEFDTTFSGKYKPNYVAQTANYFYDSIDKWPKVKYYYVEKPQWSKYIELAKQSPNTEYGKGAEHWITEFAQKESIKDCLTDLKDDDTVFIGDCDEIWNPRILKEDLFRKWFDGLRNYSTMNDSFKLSQYVYTYYLNNKSSENWFGTIVAQYQGIKNKCLNHIRSRNHTLRGYEAIDKIMLKDNTFGWHFTSLAPHLRQKLEDSYTEDSYANKAVMDKLEENIRENKDFLGRDFTYTLDESDWPPWLVINREKFAHLLK